MIDAQKLVAYIEQAPFPNEEKQRLITLACVANEEHKRHIYILVKKFTQKFQAEEFGGIAPEKAEKLRSKGRYIRGIMRKKAEEIHTETREGARLKELEGQFTTIS